MKPIRYSIRIFFAFALFVSAVPAPPRDASSDSLTLTQPFEPDLGSASNFSDPHTILIEHCGAHTAEVWDAQAATNYVANLGRVSVSAGVEMPAYKAMFKTNAVKAKVTDYFRAVGERRGSINLKPLPFVKTFPRFACATPDSARLYRSLQLGYDPWETCLYPVGREPTAAFYAEGTAYTFICPSFFQQSPQPVGRHCPTVEDNQFSAGANPFYRNHQVYTLLGELIHLYMGSSSLNGGSTPKATSDWNRCVKYSGQNSAKNPTNYIIYAALVHQTCIAIPDPFKPPFSPRLSSGSVNASTPDTADY